jgi:hypothetical protein
VEASDLRLLVDKFATSSANLHDLMHVTVFVLMYAAFLRFDDAAEISVHEDLLVICPTHVDIFLPRSKTDQYMEGTWVTVARSNGPYCPVGLLERLLRAGQYVRKPADESVDVGPLLRAVAPGGQRLKQLTGTISQPVRSLAYSTLLQRCKTMCTAAGISKTITMHSFRIGGASQAAAAGVADRIFKKHGRWQSEVVKDNYVRETYDNMLLISQALGL